MPRVIAFCCVLAITSASPLGRTVRLNNTDGVEIVMPTINLGTCCGSDPKVGLKPWLNAGGRGIDTAFDYGDQSDIAQIIRSWDRDSLFITSKVPAGFGNSSDCNPDPLITLRYVQEDIRELGIEQVDLLLLHRPCQPASSSRGPSKDPVASNNALWQGAIQALKMNLTRAIGVSNYVHTDLAALTGRVPTVNQCYMSLTKHDDATIKYCQQKGILYESYQAMKGCPFDNPDVQSIAQAHNKSAAQVCLRWVLDRGCALATGTGSDESTAGQYAVENLDIYDVSLSTEEMGRLNAIQGQTKL